MSVVPEDLRARADETILARRLAAVDELGLRPTLWLAAVPLWTWGAAGAVGFPAADLASFLQQASAAGWCKTRGRLSPRASADLNFWMPDEGRRQVIRVVRRRMDAGQILREQQYIARRLTDTAARAPAGERPGALAAWAELVTGPGGDQRADEAPRLLYTLVTRAVGQRDFSRAQDLVAAGEALAPVLAGAAEETLGRAQRILTLGLRRRQDERSLTHYLDRPELSRAVTRLLEGRAGAEPGAGQWALHLRGVGGVGKTMFIRYLASGRYAADEALPPIVVARADFDHISPDFPARRPVQLLLELADDLTLYTASNPAADRMLRLFRDSALSAHEAASDPGEAGEAPLDRPSVQRAIDAFASMIGQLGGALLILDTCEELAKADAGEQSGPAVRATFQILELLRAKAPSARVLLAGRRPLPGRPYLAVQPVLGFTVPDARRYLAESSRRPLPAALADAIIRQSPAIGEPVPAAGKLPERVSPFDLTLYQAWADDDPELDVAEVERGSDAYIENRIVGRLDQPAVLDALPVLAVGGRVRVTTMAAFLDCDPAPLGRQIGEQEWGGADGGPSGHVWADPALARRLRQYFGAGERRAEFEAQTARLAALLREGLRDLALSDIDVDELIAALRLSPPADAAALWNDITERAMDPDRWDVVLTMTQRILGEWAEDEWPTRHVLEAAVTAAHVAASRRHIPGYDMRADWARVAALASSAAGHPDPAGQLVLRGRAALGVLPYHPRDEGLWGEVETAFEAPPAIGVLWAAAVDAAHRFLEAGETAEASRCLMFLASIARSVAPGGLRLEAWASVARARLAADSEPELALTILTEAAKLVTIARTRGAEPAWPDWIPPQDLFARILIERGLNTPPEDTGILGEWEAYAAADLTRIDRERLASLCLRIRLRHAIIEPSAVDRWKTIDRYEPERRPSCTAHDLVPPLFVSVAEAWLAAGRPDRALILLDVHRRVALASGDDATTVRYADAATMRIARRLRLADEQLLLRRLADPGDRRDPAALDLRNAAWRALAVVARVSPAADAIPPGGAPRPADWHAWWQAQVVDTAALRAQPDDDSALPPMTWGPADGSAADIAADLAEMRQLEHPAAARLERATAPWLAAAPPAPPVRSADPCQDARAAIRLAALTGEPAVLRPGVPSRLLAEMAFEEAELAALRLPGVAVRLFQIAADAYAKAGDLLGEFQAVLSLTATGRADPTVVTRVARVRKELAKKDPELAARLTGQPEGAEAWRHWSRLAAQAGTGEAAEPGGAPEQPPRKPLPRRPSKDRSLALSIAKWLALLLLGTVLFTYVVTYPHPPGASLLPSGTLIAPRPGGAHLPAALLQFVQGASALLVISSLISLGAGLLWFAPRLRRIGSERGVGALRLGRAVFDARVNPRLTSDTPDGLRLSVRPRPWRSASQVARIRLLPLITVFSLMRSIHTPSTGYIAAVGNLEPALESTRADWQADVPAARPAWWQRGRDSALGLVNTGRGGQAWERILSACLGPDAAGRIAWIRPVYTGHTPTGPGRTLANIGRKILAFLTRGPDTSAGSTALEGPRTWIDNLGGEYSLASEHGLPPGSAGTLRIRHVIGQAVETSAGPAMDLAGVAGGSARDRVLRTARDLTQDNPQVVILQAEPVDEDVTVDLAGDHEHKLALAAELAGDGVPAVLLLPEIPAAAAAAVCEAVLAYGARRRRPRPLTLLTAVRASIAPSVPPCVLDDVVLFLNEKEYL